MEAADIELSRAATRLPSTKRLRQKSKSFGGRSVTDALHQRKKLVQQEQQAVVKVTASRTKEARRSFGERLKSKAPRDENKLCGITIMSPVSLKHTLWDLFITLCVGCAVITLPVGMAFDPPDMFYLNLILDIAFLFDIVVSFFTGYVNANDVLIMKPKKIAKHYLRTWFVPDLVSSIPIDPILLAVEGGQQSQSETELAGYTRSIKLVRMIRIAKLLRLLRLSRFAKYLRQMITIIELKLRISIPQGLLKMSKLVVLLVLAAHWLGCVSFMIVRLNDFPPDSWVSQSGLVDLPMEEQYTWVLLKALYNIIGGEEMMPSGHSLNCEYLSSWCMAESSIATLSLYIGAVFVALLISEVGNIMVALDRSHQLYAEKMEQINEYMRVNKLSPELRESVRDYYGVKYSDQKVFDEREILQDMSPNLRIKIREEVCANLVSRVPLLRKELDNHAFMNEFVTHLDGPLIMFCSEVVFYEGSHCNEMYFIYNGIVGILSKHADSGIDGDGKKDELGGHIAAISNGCYFGDVALLMDIPRTASARAETMCVLYRISREAFNLCLDEAPRIRRHMMQVAHCRKQRVVQLDLDYEGVVDESLEMESYVDAEDQKTELFEYERVNFAPTTAEPIEEPKRTNFHTTGREKMKQQQTAAKLSRLRRQSTRITSKMGKQRRTSKKLAFDRFIPQLPSTRQVGGAGSKVSQAPIMVESPLAEISATLMPQRGETKTANM